MKKSLMQSLSGTARVLVSSVLQELLMMVAGGVELRGECVNFWEFCER